MLILDAMKMENKVVAPMAGSVEGVECAITASDMTYRGGSMNPRSVDKGGRFREIIRQNRLPWINLNESAGADLPHQADIFISDDTIVPSVVIQISQLSAPSPTGTCDGQLG